MNTVAANQAPRNSTAHSLRIIFAAAAQAPIQKGERVCGHGHATDIAFRLPPSFGLLVRQGSPVAANDLQASPRRQRRSTIA
jgi:hypothetical protein